MSKLTLGPVLFNWNASEWRDFYFKMADEAAIDIFYLGEIVCSKRTVFFLPYIEEVIERIKRNGKQVVRSGAILIMNERERKNEKRIVGDDKYVIEANDISTISYLKGREHVIGPNINCYNEASLAYFVKNGARRVCLPSEIPAGAIKLLAQHANELGSEIEIVVYGRVGLAISARCYHARMHNLSKVNCQFVCGKDYDGHSVRTLDDQAFLTINGVQTMSHSYLNLINEISELREFGVGAYRINPQSKNMVEVAGVFREVIDGMMASDEANAKIMELEPNVSFSNGFYHQLPGYEMKAS